MRAQYAAATLRLFLLAAVTLVAACSMLPRESFTEAEQEIAQVAGFPNVRYWADAPPETLRRAIEQVHLSEEVRTTGRFNLLALSGGAYDGAFGAGVLAGWTATGTRPRFTVVTGVSAGALAAPLAFLGPDYDATLTEAFTGGMSQVLGEGGILSLLGSADMRRQTLVGIIEQFVDRRLLAAIAREHERGRRLLVVTTNIDAQRSVLWDMGAIAASRHPDARRLFIEILTASSSVPGVFAPTYIEVEAGGRRFREMHVDGGAATQFFVFPEAFLSTGSLARGPKPALSNIYIIINNRLSPQFDVVESGVLPIVGRSFSTLIKTHARYTLFSTAELARKTGIGLQLTAIGDDFRPAVKPGFSSEYMRAVYDYGFSKAQSGALWMSSLPLPSSVRQHPRPQPVR